MRLISAILIWFVVPAFPATGRAVSPHEIPFQSLDGFVWIEVTTPASLKPLHFILDSGAQVSVIHSGTAKRLGMEGGGPVTVTGVGKTTTGFWPQRAEARAGAVALPVNYLALDLGKLSEACTNAPVDGIIGADFFHDRIVQIDYEHSVVRLLSEAPAGDQVLPLKVRSCGMLVPVRINGSEPQWVRLDTGCASALQWVTGSIRPEACTRRVAVALTAFSIPTTRTTLALGNARFEDLPTDLQEKEIFPGENGLLGNGLLSRFQSVTINTKRKEVIFGPVLSKR